MNVSDLQKEAITDYRAFTCGFVDLRDERIRSFVEGQFVDGVQWPDPWLSLTPPFATGGALLELVAEGLLHPECERMFRRKTDCQAPGPGPGRRGPAAAPARGGRGRANPQ